ncbi:MAG: bidirectional hydrogenase complex protein HoxE [Desulfobacteraceae bacterium]|nr:bidirectional hydrogenase complex protein HoxE [Desulfobacteraceae bacterium]
MNHVIGFGKPHPPSGDKRWQIVDRAMRRYGYEPSALIQTLHAVQETFGYLDIEAMRYVAGSLRVPLSQVYGVATFYHFFTLKPPGEHTCMVCTGTACYIKGAEGLLAAVRETIGAKPGETTPDGKVSVLTVRCIGSCGLAPIAVLDGETASRLTPQELRERLRAWTAGGEIPAGAPTAPPERPGHQLGGTGPAAEKGGGA